MATKLTRDRAALLCVGCRRPLSYARGGWGYADGKVPECDECFQKRFAAEFPHAHRVKHRIDESE